LGQLLFLLACATHVRAASVNLGLVGMNGAPLRRRQQTKVAAPTSSALHAAFSLDLSLTKETKPIVAPPPALHGEFTPAAAWGSEKVGPTEVVPWSGVARALSTKIVTARDQATLVANLKSNTTINLQDDLYLTSSGIYLNSATGIFINNSQTNLQIDGMGLYKVDGQESVRCFVIDGDGVDVVLQNLTITNAKAVIPHTLQQSAIPLLCLFLILSAIFVLTNFSSRLLALLLLLLSFTKGPCTIF
jgi:hypothetical protein